MTHTARFSGTLPTWPIEGQDAWRNSDVDRWTNLYAKHGIHELQFAPAGSSGKVEGHGAIAAYMRPLTEGIKLGTFENARVWGIGDETIIEVKGVHIAFGHPKEFDYVWFITRHDGKIMTFRDYVNPLQLKH